MQAVKVTMRASETGSLQVHFLYRVVDGEQLTSERSAALELAATMT